MQKYSHDDNTKSNITINLIVLSQLVQEAIASVLPKICDELEHRELIRLYPKWIKGNIKASEILGITPNALSQRVLSGKYRENLHFKKKSPKIYLWDRDTLLQERKKSETI